ncbi:MAG: transposase [Opitutales bacterium]|nr:transposase [Opitutales bacterium]
MSIWCWSIFPDQIVTDSATGFLFGFEFSPLIVIFGCMPHPHKHLPRLAVNYYKGRCFVFWTLCIKNRKTGWLDSLVHAHIREILLHVFHRYQIVTNVYTIMPDHMHLICEGWSSESDQLEFMSFFKRWSNFCLKDKRVEWQRQSYDHVLREDELKKDAFLKTQQYILNNPVRKQLVEFWNEYAYSGLIIPGYPSVDKSLELMNQLLSRARIVYHKREKVRETQTVRLRNW